MDYGIYCFIKFQHNSETLLEIASMFIVKHFDCVMYEPKWPDFVREQPELLMQVKLYAYHLWINDFVEVILPYRVSPRTKVV